MRRYATRAPRDSSSTTFGRLQQISRGRREEQSTPLLPFLGECDHNYPIVVWAAEEDKPHRRRRAQCLGCKKLGPAREDSQSARQALLLAIS